MYDRGLCFVIDKLIVGFKRFIDCNLYLRWFLINYKIGFG